MKKKMIILLLIIIPLTLTEVSAAAVLREYVHDGIVSQVYGTSPNNVTWWGGDLDEGAVFGDVDEDGNAIICCYSKSFDLPGTNLFIAKFSNTQQLLWNKTWAVPEDTLPCGLVLDGNNHTYIAGTYIREVGVESYVHDVFILKYFNNGTRDWVTTQNTSTNDDPTSLAISTNGDLFVVGQTNSSQGALFLQKYSSGGSLLWERHYGTTTPRENILAGGMEIDSTGNIYIAATTDNSPGSNMEDLVLLKFNSAGSVQWNATFGGTAPQDKGYDIILLNNEIYVVGDLASDVAQPTDAVVVKFNTEGVIQWNTTFNLANDHGYAITTNQKDHLVITGTTDYSQPQGDLLMVELDKEGKVLWNTTWDGGLADTAYSITTHQEYLFIFAQGYNTTNGSYDVAIITFKELAYYPTSNPLVGKIIAYIIGIPIMIFSIVTIAALIITSYLKDKPK